MVYSSQFCRNMFDGIGDVLFSVLHRFVHGSGGDSREVKLVFQYVVYIQHVD